ncbi:D-proline reductase (dithiol) proprotein PrdA [Thermosediminibacter oceani]|uniref:D-proline reductase (Dithiol) n=1 Tax=Thermosediminibacter oceani (strain ATCC BAA-1034 / DSM 16646 / JW/IW-1228P) TaxID=555079 RepID=D9RYJ5_THEOJ|nr:D-proline reductase (dithiol) proprotein PrdA [Thermosediminibacter oceani]ADL08419.1 D-proline reductase (dithiol) [Thermosediminibacter oceani DSM 16646]
MSITPETANQHKNDPAVVCCLTHEGTIISPADLEDPAIFPDLEDSGLLTIPENVLTIGQVLGKKLIKTIDALTPITPDMIEGGLDQGEKPEVVEEAEMVQSGAAQTVTGAGNVIRIHIEEGKGINLEIPAIVTAAGTAEPAAKPVEGAQEAVKPRVEDRVRRTLLMREFEVKEVRLGDETSFENGVLTIRKGLVEDALKADPIAKKMEIDIITPDNKNVFTNTIMDVIPIATKVEGSLGEGVTHVMSGAVVILTGVDESGIQVHEFGSCEGIIGEKVRFGRPGCPDENDIMIRIHVTIQAGTGMERKGPYAAHKACDAVIQEIREVLKKKPASEAAREIEYKDVERIGRPRVVIVKEIMGQGAMHDNVILPKEPAGVLGGRPNVDLGNIPVVLSANEVRDGGIHALTCIGPASKENTRHYFREPLVNLVADDEEVNLVGVVFVGSPQVNEEKFYVSERLGALVEALGVDGAIVTTEGFGNNHIDFASHIEQIGKRGIPVVGVTYAAYQGQLIVGNKYMDAMVELNKDPNGMESEILGDNTLTKEDAVRALAMLKAKMAGAEIKPAPKKWDQSVIENNQKLVEKA